NINEIALTNPLYKFYTSNYIPVYPKQREASLGTAIMVYCKLQMYIHNIITYPRTAICIDFFFPGNNKTRVISLYLPNDHADLLKRTQRQVALWITEAKNKNWTSIVLGDFNTNELRKDKNITIFSDLTASHHLSLLNSFNITTPI